MNSICFATERLFMSAILLISAYSSSGRRMVNLVTSSFDGIVLVPFGVILAPLLFFIKSPLDTIMVMIYGSD